MKKYLSLAVISLVFICNLKSQTYVNQAVSGGANDGTSWANAYSDLQTALTNTSSGEIWVASGTYFPGASGANTATFLLKNGVSILGGFNGSETVNTQRDPAANVTILSGDLDQSGSFTGNDAYHVVSTGNTNSGAFMDGFVIRGGNANSVGINAMGAGVLCNPTTPVGPCNPVISHCIIRNNNAAADGAGVAIVCQNLTSTSASPTFYNCRVLENVALGVGGGFYVYAEGNTTTAEPLLENCLVYNNSAAGGGYVIHAVSAANGQINMSVVGCTFAFDQPGDEVVYVSNTFPGNFYIKNTIFYGLQISTDAGFTGDNNCGTTIPYLTGTGNFDLDPSFINPGAFDYRLGCYSPCINNGSNLPVTTSMDAYGNPRISNTFVDIGAHETNYSTLFITPNASPSNSVCDGSSVTLYGSGPGGVSYAWTGGVIDASPFNPTITDTYTVTGTDTNGCVATETITVTVNPLPTVTANASSSTVCVGTSLFVYGTGAISFSWDNGVSDGIPFTPSVTTYYTVTGTDANGCVNTAGVNVVVEDSTMVSAGPDMDVCRTGTPFINLAGNNSGSLAFQWTTDGSGSFTNDMMPNSDYYFSGADASSPGINLICTVNYTACGTTIDTMHVTFWDPASVNAGGDLNGCANEATGITVNGSETGSSSILWNSTNGGFFSSPSTLFSFYDASPAEISGGLAVLYLTAFPMNPACPTVYDTMQIILNTPPAFSLGADYTICETDSIQLQTNITGGTGPFNYNWSNGATISTTLGEMYLPLATENISLLVSDVYGCYGKDTVLVTVDASNMLSGTINVGAAPLTDGTMYMFKYIPQQLAFDTMFVLPFTAGTGAFSFSSFPHGTYLIKIVPDTLIFPNVLPTYFGDAFQWDSATVINHNCLSDYTANINMLQLLGGTGTGMITGHILEGQGFGTRLDGTNPHIMVPGGPLKGIDVKLGKNPAGGIQARTMSDSTGYYEFTDLPFDSYRIYVDVPGLPMDSFYVISMITSTDSVYNMDYMVDSNSVYPMLPTAVGIPHASDSELKHSLYPNPASSYTSVDFELNSGSSVNIELLDVSGRVLWTAALKDLPKGKHQYQINFADAGFVNGMYFIRVKDRASSKTSKLVIEK